MRLQEQKSDQHVGSDEEIVMTVEQPKPIRRPVGTWKTFSIGLALTIFIGCVATLLAPLPGLAVMGSLTVALLLGLAWRAVVGLPKTYMSGVRFSAQKLLRYGIILTGVRLNFALIISSGVQVLLLDALLIAFGVGLLPLVMHRLGLPKRLAFLIGVGQSICGASAVGAMAALFPEVDEDDVSLAVAICGLVGTVGVLLFGFGIHLLPISSNLYGLLTGSTLHEIAQVVAAGAAGGPKAADLAMVVKLTRVMLLAPVALIVAFIFALRAERRTELGARRSFSWKKIPIPWFVFGFLAVGAVNSLGLFPKSIANIIMQISVFLLVVAMAAMGLMVDLAVIRRTGLKAVGVALLVFFLFVTVSLMITAVVGRI
jgi:uncharacterized integral membrane protein (TIGR00698 family)